MAVTYPNQKIIRAPAGPRYVHRQATLTVGTSAAQGEAAASGAASALVSIPGPGRLVALRYGVPAATRGGALTAVANAGALTIKAETTAGVQVWTDADYSGVVGSGFMFPVGTAAVDEGNAATAATDGFSGGFPVRKGVRIDIASGTDADVCQVDMLFRLSSYIQFDLISQSGADGAGVQTKTINWGRPGVLAAAAFDFQNMPTTTDIVVYADEVTTGAPLFTATSTSTDIAPKAIGRPAFDEAINVTAATDGTEAGNAFFGKLVVDMAQADAFTGGNEKVVCEFWIDD